MSIQGPKLLLDGAGVDAAPGVVQTQSTASLTEIHLHIFQNR